MIMIFNMIMTITMTVKCFFTTNAEIKEDQQGSRRKQGFDLVLYKPYFGRRCGIDAGSTPVMPPYLGDSAAFTLMVLSHFTVF